MRFVFSVFVIITVFACVSFYHLHTIVSLDNESSPLSIDSLNTFLRGGPDGKTHASKSTSSSSSLSTTATNNNKKHVQILHIVTSLSEFDSGTRGTKKGNSRLREKLIPVLNETVTTLLSPSSDNYQFDVSVQLVLGYTLSPENLSFLKNVLPSSVRDIFVWNDAIPKAYDENEGEVRDIKRSLARGHRYVIANHFEEFDFFSAWEDDMQVKRR